MASDDDRASTPEHTPDAPPSRTDSQAATRQATAYDWLPDDLDPIPYVELRPSDTPLDHAAVQTALRRIPAVLRDHESRGLTATLTRSTRVPRVEVLLVADGDPDTGIRYLVGVRQGDADLRGTIRDILRTALPNDTEFTETEFHPLEPRRWCPPPARDDIEGSAGDGSADSDPDGDPTTTDDVYAVPAPDEPLPDAAEPYVAAVDYYAATRNRRDWQTPLTPFTALAGDTAGQTDTRVPLAQVAEALADARVPAVYQTVVRAHRDWASDAERYVDALAADVADDRVPAAVAAGNAGTKAGTAETGPAPSSDLPNADQRRIAGIGARDTRATVSVSARAVALTRRDHDVADALADRLATAFAPLAGEFHTVGGRVVRDRDRGFVGRALAHLPFRDSRPPGKQVYATLLGAGASTPTYASPRSLLPFTTPTSPGMVVDPAALGAFCVAGGAELPPASARALNTQRPARTGLALPPPGELARYRGAGWPLGRPVDADRTVDDEPVVLPPHLQTLHLLVVGATGAGKSTTTTTGMLANHEVTDGPAILFDAKGGGMARDYLRAHYARYGDLEDVLYFDCTEVLPAVSVLDIRPLLDAGVSREEARSRVAGHYQEILASVMGRERFERAVRSPDVIRNHVKALFDPVHGADAVAHRDLLAALQRTERDGEPPAVSDPDLDAHFQSLLAAEPRVFSRIMGGALSRVETIATDGRLAPLFNHVPARGDESDAGPETAGDGSTHHTDDEPTTPHDTDAVSFSVADLLDEDRVVIVDFGGMEDSVKDTLTMVLLAALWTALKARQERAHEHERATEGAGEDASGADHPLVNLYLEDAGSVAGTRLVDTLLSQGRSFGLSVTLGVQYPGQLETSDPDTDTYRELLNETATMLVGNVGVDDGLARALATTALPPDKLARRLASLGRGEWLCRPAAGFGEAPPAPFLVESLNPPAGHPASAEAVDEAGFREALARCEERTTARHGIARREVSHVDGATAPESDADGDATDEEREADTLPSRDDLTTTLRHTERMPSCVTHNEAAGALQCTSCGSRYNPTDDGMARAVECCRGLGTVDHDDIPVVETNVKLAPETVVDADWSLQQLLFLQIVHNAQQGRYEAPGYDIVHDSMVLLRGYAGVETDDVLELKEAGLLVEDGNHPHRLYSVTSDGRSVIHEGRREGLDYGDGKGDLDETSQHRMAVEVGRRVLEREYADDPASDVVRAKPYHEIAVDGETRRLDCAGLDADGEVVVALEAERINNDVADAVPADFDKMAACDPEEAIWITLSRSDGARVVAALADPPDGEPRVATTYNERTATYKYQIDTPGLTDVFTVTYVRDTLLSES